MAGASLPLERAAEPPDDGLINAATGAALKAYAPYSGFHVGCVAIAEDGTQFSGANMENASYGLSMCAEVGALTAATVAGALDSIATIIVAGGRVEGGRLAGEATILPCGRCRQLISEAASLGHRDIKVIAVSGDGKNISEHAISELLPHAFGPEHLD